MHWKSVHEIQIVHRWKAVDYIRPTGGIQSIIRSCQDCGGESRLLRLSSNNDSISDDPSQTERINSLQDIGEQFKGFSEIFDEMSSELLEGSDCPTMDDLIKRIELRHEGKVSGGEMPYRVLKLWIDTPKMFQAKTLLACKQGLVCNRCDRLMYSFDQLTVDHIVPDRSRSQLTNLQLLCKKCNHDKGDNPPDHRDISPFNFVGESCMHGVTCIELDRLRLAYEKSQCLSAEQSSPKKSSLS